MRVWIVLFSAVQCIGTAEFDQDLKGTDTCQFSDDCVEGYTSLLQDSMRLSSAKLHDSGGRRNAAEGKGLTKSTSSQRASMGGDASTSAESPAKRGFSTTKGKPWMQYLWIGVGGALLVAAFYYTCWRPYFATSHGAGEQQRHQARQATLQESLVFIVNDPDSKDEVEQRIHDPLEEDAYSLAIVLLVRDLRSLSLGEGKPGLKFARIGFAVALIVITTGITISIVICTKSFVTPLQVADIRDAYATFETVMYGGHTYLNKNGKTRGMPGFFDASLFDNLSDDEQSAACNIPFSQLNFLFIILMVWSITCVASLKKCFELFLSLIILSENHDDMRGCLKDWEGAIGRDDQDVDEPLSRLQKVSEDENQADEDSILPVQVITGLTPKLKLFLSIFVFLPELLTTLYLLWLGCRWLAATNDFADMVCNAVALEFVLQLKCMLYYALASERNKRDLKMTAIAPAWTREGAGFGVYFNTLAWALLALIWVWAYIFHFQQVLPDYKWDVHQVCNPWLLNILAAADADGS